MYIWLALRFPLFKLEAHGVDTDKHAAVVASSRVKVCAATPSCEQEGVCIGMPISTAQTLMNCSVHLRSRDKEQALIQRVCELLYAFTPYIQTYYPNEKDESCDQGLLLELSRCTRLFGGLEPLVNKITDALLELGLSFTWALSKSAKASWLLSARTNSEGQDTEAIFDIETKHLDEFPEQALALEEMGFLLLRDIKQHIQSEGVFSLQKRFASAFMQYLLDILYLGSDDEQSLLLAPNAAYVQEDFFSKSNSEQPGINYNSALPSVIYQPEEHYNDSLVFDFPITSLELLHAPMQNLLKDLSDFLVSKQKQCGGIQWRFSDIYHNREILEVRCELIYRDWMLLYELSLIKLEQSGLPFEVDQLELMKPLLVDAELSTEDLAITKPERVNDIRAQQRVVTKIKARLGDSKVFKVSYKDEHFPECAQRNIAVEEQAIQSLEREHRHAIRPGWILNTPITIGKHQNNLRWNGKLELIRGPERLEGHWWDKPTARDYFIAVREDNVRLWVFNDLFREEWFVQGVF